MLLGIRRDDIPEVITGVETADVGAGARDFHVANHFGEHRRRADAEVIRNRIRFGLPFKVNARGFRIFRHDWRKIFRLEKFRWRKHVGFLNRSAANDRRALMRIQFAMLLPVLHFRAAAGNRNLALAGLRIRFYGGVAVRADQRLKVFAADFRARLWRTGA